jgi:hypothetical protein
MTVDNRLGFDRHDRSVARMLAGAAGRIALSMCSRAGADQRSRGISGLYRALGDPALS